MHIKQIINEVFYRYDTYRISYKKLIQYLSYIIKKYPDDNIMELCKKYVKNLPSSFSIDLHHSLNKKNQLIVKKEELKDYHFTRLDTIGDGSCFFHSVLMCICDNNYNNCSTKDKMTMVKKVRQHLADNLLMDTWEALNEGKLMIKEINSFLLNKFSYNSNLCEFLFNAQLTSETFDEYISILKDNKCARKIIVHMDLIKKHCFDKYREKLTDSSVWVGTEDTDVDAINLFADFLGIDIYVFSVYKSMPNVVPYHSSFSYSKNHKKRPSICILNSNNTHFESMGVLYENSNGGIYTKQLFSSNDNMVKKLYNIINN